MVESEQLGSDIGGGAGRLFIVATPIGNLADMSDRAVATLRRVDRVLAEDTRVSMRLLEHFGIDTPLESLHEHNETARTGVALARLAEGWDLALISDAGTPLISDPGYRLVCAVAQAGHDVRPIPGASAVTAALSVAGLPTDRFLFEGFLPAKHHARCKRLVALAEVDCTLVFYEAPHRLLTALDDMIECLGPLRQGCIARELTKRYEDVRRDTLATLAESYRTDPGKIRGELVIVVAGAQAVVRAPGTNLDQVLTVLLEYLPVSQAAEAAHLICATRKNETYRRALELSRE